MVRARQILKGLTLISRDIVSALERQVQFQRKAPVAALLFLTFRCNSRCKTCIFWTRSFADELKKEIPFERWKSIIDELAAAGVKVVEVFGGNVLLRKDLLISVIRYLKERNIIVHLPLNQIGIDEQVAEEIVRNTDFVYFSTDGVGTVQDEIRGHPGASRGLDEIITMFRSLRKNRKTPRLICNTTVSRLNVGLLDRVAEYALSRRFDEVAFEYVGEFTRDHVNKSVVDGSTPTPYFLRQRESLLVSREDAHRLKENVRMIKRRFQQQGFSVGTVNIDTLSERNLTTGTIPYSKCHVIRVEPVVDPYGNLIACPHFNNYIIGSLLDQPFDMLWNSERHLTFRARQQAGALELCRHCILGVERNFSLLGSFKRIYYSRIAPKLGTKNRAESVCTPV